VTQVHAALASLESLSWIDVHTKIVELKFNVYNPSYDTLAVVVVTFSIKRSGLVLARVRVRTLRLMSLTETDEDKFLFALELLFMLAFIVHASVFFTAMYRRVRSRLEEKATHGQNPTLTTYTTAAISDFWIGLHLFNIILIFISSVLRIHFAWLDEVTNFHFSSPRYEELEPVADWFVRIFDSGALPVFISFTLLMRHVVIGSSMKIIIDTLITATMPFLYFSFLFAVLYSGFVFVAWISFGPSLFEFRNPFISWSSLFSMTLGEVEVYGDRIAPIESVVAAPFFAFFVMFVALLMVNLFIAIFNQAYIEEMARHADAGALKGGQSAIAKRDVNETVNFAKAFFMKGKNAAQTAANAATSARQQLTDSARKTSKRMSLVPLVLLKRKGQEIRRRRVEENPPLVEEEEEEEGEGAVVAGEDDGGTSDGDEGSASSAKDDSDQGDSDAGAEEAEEEEEEAEIVSGRIRRTAEGIDVVEVVVDGNGGVSSGLPMAIHHRTSRTRLSKRRARAAEAASE